MAKQEQKPQSVGYASVITTRPEQEIIKVGMYVKVGALDAQASYTTGIAAGDMEALTEILGGQFFAATAKAQAFVAQLVGDRSVAEDESQSKTIAQNVAVRKVTIWRRKVMNLGTILKHRGVQEASDLCKITSPDKSLNNLRTEVEQKISQVRDFAPKAPNPAWANKLAADGGSLLSLLKGADAAQEVDIKKLPVKTREAYLQKGILYEALKQINAAGKSLHAENSKEAAQYSMEILHRSHHVKPKPDDGQDPKTT